MRRSLLGKLRSDSFEMRSTRTTGIRSDVPSLRDRRRRELGLAAGWLRKLRSHKPTLKRDPAASRDTPVRRAGVGRARPST